MSRITEKEVEYVAHLARIKLTAKEREKLTGELEPILDYVNKIGELDLAGVEPTAQVTGMENVFRDDTNSIEPSLENTEKLVGQAPRRKENFVKVKSILEAK
ncbi:MAG: glutamyl-tRNA(Gln) amidotransferase subunit C [Parcubacteria group bacterium Licking1014_17]|nr:MAG: glutamyl-tRNA(Gln) amidotransferase subunit C [Parcubacteria group bacterium Licking1014_17]